MKCPNKNCNAENASNAKFCNQCGAKLEAFKTCPYPDCGTERLPLVARFCPDCGRPLEKAAPIQEEEVVSPNRYDVPTDMILVKGGTFEMGTNYKVTLSDYCIGKYPVSQKLWKEIMGSNPSYHKGDDLLPVEEVCWYDAILFCNKLSKKRGIEECYRINGDQVEWLKDKRGYRLLTEAEWEYAARGGKESKSFTYSGGNELYEVGWYKKNSDGKPHPVGMKIPNSLGIYDMSGNVWEWCWDRYDLYPSSHHTNPSGSTTAPFRVNRGGSWYSSTASCTVSYRDGNTPVCSSSYLGFRLAFACSSK